MDSKRHLKEGEKAPVLSNWFKDRLPWEALSGYMAGKYVPRHKHSFWYLFGGLTLFFFIVQVVSGMLLLLYYSPTPDTAHESVMFIMTQVPFGWLIRSVHSWSSHLMVAAMFVHFFSTFLMKAYRKPREMMWLTGVLQLFLVLGFAFTGYLLPWDTLAYFATKIGTEIPKSTPLVGNFVVDILRGGSDVGSETMKRLFALHVSVLPIITIGFIIIHLMLNQVYGTSAPIGAKLRDRGVRFYPTYIYRDAISWIAGLMILMALALIYPVTLGPKANSLAAAPPGIKPAWYFLSLYQTIKVFPGQIFSLNGEMIVNIIVGFTGVILLILPFLDRRSSREEPNITLTVIGIAAILYLSIMTILAYTT